MMKIPTSAYRFVVSGGISTCIDFCCYIMLMSVLCPSAAKALSMVIANVWSFLINRNWVFSSRQQVNIKTIGLYIVTQFLNLATNVGVNSVMLSLTYNVVLSFVVATLCATIVNYSLQKIIVFR